MRGLGWFSLGVATGVLGLAVGLGLTGRRQQPAPAPTVTAVVTPNAATAPVVTHPVVTHLEEPKFDPRDFTAASEPLSPPPDVAAGKAPDLSIASPIAGLARGALQDTFYDARGGGARHEAIDIPAPRGTPVLAAVEGNVVKLFTSRKGGLTVYQFDDARDHCYYYAHLDRYAPGLKEGMLLRKGDPLGFVGSTGDAQGGPPHLHFAILKLGPDKHWWENTTATDPFPLLAGEAR